MTDRLIDRKLPSVSRIEELEGKIEGLEANLDNAVETAYLRGATEWVRLNLPSHYERPHRQFDSWNPFKQGFNR